MGLFSFVGGLLGGGSQKKATNQATNAIVSALNRGIDTQNAFQQQTRQDYLPYTQAGIKGITAYGDLAGVNGADAETAAIGAAQDSPLYQALFRNGQETLLQNAAATGGIRGGDTQRGLADFGSDTLANVIAQRLAGFQGLGQMGLGAQGAVTATGQNVANQNTNLLGQIGGAQATNYLTKGGINARNWQNAGGFLDSIASSFIPGGAGLGGALKSIF